LCIIRAYRKSKTFEHQPRSSHHSAAVALSKLEHRAPFVNSKLHVMTIMGIVQRNTSCFAAYNYERRHGSAAVSAISIFRIVVYMFSFSLCSFSPSHFHSRRPLFALFAAIVIARESTRTLGRGVTREKSTSWLNCET